MSRAILPHHLPTHPIPPRDRPGVVFTRPWVVELLLDLAGYREGANLVDALAVEPAAGAGGFLVPMARRLVASCRRQGRPLGDCARSLLGYELDGASAAAARAAVAASLAAMGVPRPAARELSRGWIRTGDYLLEAGRLPRADFVVGNSPYVRLEDIDAEAQALYRSLYPTMRGRADLYVAFFEAALGQLKPGGVCAFICADRRMRNQYGAGLRGHVTAGFDVRTVIEMHDADAFEAEVSAYPALTVIRRGPQGPAVIARAGREAEAAGAGMLAATLEAARAGPAPRCAGLAAAGVASWFARAEPWPCSTPERLALLKDLESRFPALASKATGTRVRIGVATGLDDVYITDDAALVEPSRLVPLALPADVRGGTLAWSGHYLVDPWGPNGLVDLDECPRLRGYFLRHEDRLKERHVAKRKPAAWYRTIDRVNHALTGRPKLYIADIKDRVDPVLDGGQTYPHHNVYYVVTEAWDLEVLGALLMSAVGQFFLESYAVRMRGGYLRCQAQYLRRIRVPRPADISRQRTGALIRAFRDRDVAAATRVALALYGIGSIPKETR